jgi:positive regulator of sigma E activity
MPVFNFLFSLLESAALVLMVPVLFIAVGGLMGATILLRRRLRGSSGSLERAQLWTREFQQGA